MNEVNDSSAQRESANRHVILASESQSFLTEGNKHFVYKRFTSAIADYTKGLQPLFVDDPNSELHHQPDCVFENAPNKNSNPASDVNLSTKVNPVFLDLLSNRALAYLSIGNYTAALEDTQKALSINPTHFKAIFRKVKALAGLAQYQSAIKFANQSIQSLRKNKQISSSDCKELELYLEKLRRMKEQSETGDFYDVLAIMDKPYEHAPADWVDYVGQVKVEKFPGKGRGLVAAQDLPPAKLVLACRAFEVIFLEAGMDPEENISQESKEALETGHFKVEDDPTLNLLARKIYDRLIQNPEKRDAFYQLHAGNELGHLEPSPDSKEVPPLDMERIYGICRTNTFANSGDSYPEVEKSVGLWLFPAYVNHQCIGGNCTWKIFSDYIFVRTFKAVKKGEELIHSYVSPAYPFRARTEVLTKRLGFVCTCVLCGLDRSLPRSVHEEKDKLKQLVFNQEINFSQLDHTESSEEYAKKFQKSAFILEQIISKLEKIQVKHGQYNASLLDPLQKLGLKYFGVGQFEKAAQIMERVCTLMNACMLPHGVADCAMWIVAAHLQSGHIKDAKKWGKILKQNLILAYGDVQVLNHLGPWVIEPMTEWGLV